MIRKKPAPHLMRGVQRFPRDKRGTRLRGDHAQNKRARKRKPAGEGGRKSLREEALSMKRWQLLADSIVFAIDRKTTVIGAMPMLALVERI
jgi:hypothetical protein